MTQQEFFTRYTYNTRTDKLGGGAFGTVYKAYDNVLDKYVAIKISEVKTIGGKEFSLMDEFNAIKGLSDHANIAKYEQLFSFDQPNGVFDFAIIQYYHDGNLKDLIKNEKLTQTEKENIAKQILEGLSFLHHHKVVHRDMKPSNILIHKREGKNYIPKIADFGLSKKADPNAKSRFTNSFGGGTLEYSSPEQLRGQNLRFNTDLWAWAVIVYELFTEKPLFQPKNNNTASAENEKEIFEQILNKDISSSLQDLPTNWSNALMACLDRNPETRVKTAGEIQNILNEKIHPLQKPEPPKGNEEKEELNLKEDKTKIFENEDIKKEKKKSYKYLLWLIPIIITFVSVLLFFSLNNKPAEAVETDDITDSVSTNVNDSISKLEREYKAFINSDKRYRLNYEKKYNYISYFASYIRCILQNNKEELEKHFLHNSEGDLIWESVVTKKIIENNFNISEEKRKYLFSILLALYNSEYQIFKNEKNHFDEMNGIHIAEKIIISINPRYNFSKTRYKRMYVEFNLVNDKWYISQNDTFTGLFDDLPSLKTLKKTTKNTNLSNTQIKELGEIGKYDEDVFNSEKGTTNQMKLNFNGSDIIECLEYIKSYKGGCIGEKAGWVCNYSRKLIRFKKALKLNYNIKLSEQNRLKCLAFINDNSRIIYNKVNQAQSCFERKEDFKEILD